MKAGTFVKLKRKRRLDEIRRSNEFKRRRMSIRLYVNQTAAN